MSETVGDTQPAKDQSALINDLEALLAMCQMKRKAEGETAFQRWMIAAVVLGILGFVAMALLETYALKAYALWPLCFALMSAALGMCNYPVDPTMTKEECAQVFSRFNHLPDREALLERYAQNGTLSYQEVAIPLRKALYELRLLERKTEIMELAKGVKNLSSKAI